MKYLALFTRNKFSKNLRVNLILAISGVSSFIYPLIKLNESTIVHDWGFFNGISHVTRSAFIYYKTIPIHNPWILGGVDYFANPQTRIFSPMVLFDLAFPAPTANLFSLIALGIIGIFGFYKLMLFLKIDNTSALISGIIFIHGSWFSLHYSEGHIIYGSFQLMGWALYFILRLQEENFKTYYALLNAFYLLDGAIYAFIFTNLLLVICLLLQLHHLSTKGFINSLFSQWKTVLVSFFLFISLSSAKLIPFLMMHASRVPILEFVTLDLKLIVTAFFNPFQHLNKEIQIQDFPFRFHEVGAYIGILGTVLVLYFFLAKKINRNIFKLLLLGLFFFWIGSGWLADFNPWRLFHKIPILNNAHVQTRFLFFTWFVFVILLSFSLNYIKEKVNRSFLNTLYFLLIAEAVFVSTYPFYKGFTFEDIYCTNVFDEPIKNHTILITENQASEAWGYEFLHYFKNNRGAKFATEPATVKGDIRSVVDDNYLGEIYLTDGSGKTKLISYTPGKVKFAFQLDTISEIQLNTNFLLGWKTFSSAELYEKNGLLTVRPKALNGIVEAFYRPNYLKVIIPLYFSGWITLIFMCFRIYNRSFQKR
jgi:hypothetical protein